MMARGGLVSVVSLLLAFSACEAPAPPRHVYEPPRPPRPRPTPPPVPPTPFERERDRADMYDLGRDCERRYHETKDRQTAEKAIRLLLAVFEDSPSYNHSPTALLRAARLCVAVSKPEEAKRILGQFRSHYGGMLQTNAAYRTVYEEVLRQCP